MIVVKSVRLTGRVDVTLLSVLVGHELIEGCRLS